MNPSSFNENRIHDEENLLVSDTNLGGEASSLAPSSSTNRYNYGNQGAVSAKRVGGNNSGSLTNADDVRAKRLALLGKVKP